MVNTDAVNRNQSKETLANRAIAYCEVVMQPLWERDYPDDLRPQKALRAARAIAQSASTIHSARHCIGLAFYGAVANEPNPAKINGNC